MKKSDPIFLILSLLISFSGCSSDNDNNLKRFIEFSEEKCFKLSHSDFLYKKGTHWQIIKELNDVGGARSPYPAPDYIWFTKNSTLYASAELGEYSFIWDLYFAEKNLKQPILLRQSEFQYNNQYLSSTNQILGEEDQGVKYYIQQISDIEMTIRLEFPEIWEIMGLQITGWQLHYQIILAPDLDATQNFNPDEHIFHSNEEAIAYVKSQMEE